MRILFIGDIVGRSGRTIVIERLPVLISDWKLDLVVVNGENAAGGFGITEVIYNELVDAGADAITLGNHAWDQREALVFIERAPRLIRPLNFPKGTPGRGSALVDAKNGKRALVINAMGRIFMDPLDEADGATGSKERWLAVYDEPRSAAVGRLTELPIPRAAQRVFLVSLSEAIRRVRQRADGLGLVLPEPGQWGAALEAYLAEVKLQREYDAQPRAKAA